MSENNSEQKNQVQVDAQFLINALEERVLNLTKENIMLSAALQQYEQNSKSKGPSQITE